MTNTARLLVGLFSLLGAMWGLPTAARAETEVDVASVLAVDGSYSMDRDEQRLQGDGFVEAFRYPMAQDAIRKGALGRIAVIYMEWPGQGEQSSLFPGPSWTGLRLLRHRPEAGKRDRLPRRPRRRSKKPNCRSQARFRPAPILKAMGISSPLLV